MSRYNYFTQASNQKNSLKTMIGNMDIDLDEALLAAIQDYVSRVRQNPTDTKECLNLNITILENPNLLSLFHWDGDEDTPSGVYLQVCTDFMSEEEIRSYDKCNLRSYFDEDNCVYLYYDAELICRVIQYLSLNVFDVFSNKIEIKVSTVKNVILNNEVDIKDIVAVLASGFMFGALICLFEYLDFFSIALITGSGVWLLNRLYSSLKKSNQLNYVPHVLGLILVVGGISFFLLSYLIEC